jgi:hypothetical protein
VGSPGFSLLELRHEVLKCAHLLDSVLQQRLLLVCASRHSLGSLL